MGHYCEEHGTVFFKKGKMKGYAHPLEENGQTIGWCNEPEEGGDEVPETATGESGTVPPTRNDEITENMFWKLLGEAIFSKDIDTSKPYGKALRATFYAKMLSVLPIKIEKEE